VSLTKVDEYKRYKALLERVIDGDSFVYDVDLGFNMWTRQRFRLKGINCPETRGKEKVLGDKCEDYILNFLGFETVIRTYKSDSFGRWLCDVELDSGQLLTEHLVREGYALEWDGKGERPKFDISIPYPMKTKEKRNEV